MGKQIASIIIALLVGCMAPAMLQAQSDTLNRLDAQGRKQGFWRKYRDNGNLLYEGQFRNNQPAGIMRRYTTDGVLFVEMNYASNPIRAKFFYPNGQIMAEGFYRQQLRDSLWLYYTENGVLRYILGRRNGRFRQFYPSGKLMESALWTDGRLNGRLMQYFDNGLNRCTMTYTMGEMNGEFKVYHPNGKLRVLGFYVNGLKQNEWVYYNANGEVIDTVVYDKGVAQGRSDLMVQDDQEFQELLKNAGKIKEPDFDNFMQ